VCSTPGGTPTDSGGRPAELRYINSVSHEVQFKMDAQVDWTLVGDPDTLRCPPGSRTPPRAMSSRASGLNFFVDAAGGSWYHAYAMPPGLYRGYATLSKIFSPSNLTATPDVLLSLGVDNNVRSLTNRNGNVWQYYSTLYRSEVATPQQASGVGSVVFYDRYGHAIRTLDPLLRATTTLYDDFDRPVQVTRPEGDMAITAYDVRGNVIQETRRAKAGSGLADIVTSTTYKEGPTVKVCVSPILCNKPDYAIDARGMRTSYAWDAAIGEVTSLTTGLTSGGACQLAGGLCPMTTFGYTAYTGATGFLGESGGTLNLPTSKIESIDGTATTKTTYVYDAASKFVIKEAVSDSTGFSLRSCYKFDAIGNLIAITEPRAGLAVCP
jgi:hypothetical protein